VVRALWDGGVAQWWSALWDGGIAQWWSTIWVGGIAQWWSALWDNSITDGRALGSQSCELGCKTLSQRAPVMSMCSSQ